ncbi:MAG: hypothetical protein MJZ67_08755 [Bacteroidales bacterium]|nr:hypothetical protein [Bacteroidales bacterium]
MEKNEKGAALVAADVMNKVSEKAKTVVDKAVSVGKDIYSHIEKTKADTRESESKTRTGKVKYTQVGDVPVVEVEVTETKEKKYK